jgi:hypothetical protein
MFEIFLAEVLYNLRLGKGERGGASRIKEEEEGEWFSPSGAALTRDAATSGERS